MPRLLFGDLPDIPAGIDEVRHLYRFTPLPFCLVDGAVRNRFSLHPEPGYCTRSSRSHPSLKKRETGIERQEDRRPIDAARGDALLITFATFRLTSRNIYCKCS
jgi:hypothetical protein